MARVIKRQFFTIFVRVENDWPLEEPAAYETWYRPTGAKGYTDWKFYSENKEEESKQKLSNL